MSLKDLQTKLGLVADGVIGKKTLSAARDYFQLSNEQTAHFFGQCYHESGGFKLFSENLNYSKDGLLKIFRKYFDENKASSYARKPEKIANLVYSNRMGNGSEDSGDGWKFRGRGAIQLTGKNNYTEFSNSINHPEILKNPDIVATEFAFESAKFFFDKNNIWDLADTVNDNSITKVTKRINGGTNGLSERIEKTKEFYKILKG